MTRMWIGILSSVCLALLLAGSFGGWWFFGRGSAVELTDPIPPRFEHAHQYGFSDPLQIVRFYEEDEAESDKHFKGKVANLPAMGTDSRRWKNEVKADDDGRKYVSYCYSDNPREEREVMRCYLYRAENPIVEIHGEGGSDWGLKGICKGRSGGVVILENCMIYIYRGEGQDY